MARQQVLGFLILLVLCGSAGKAQDVGAVLNQTSTTTQSTSESPTTTPLPTKSSTLPTTDLPVKELSPITTTSMPPVDTSDASTTEKPAEVNKTKVPVPTKEATSFLLDSFIVDKVDEIIDLSHPLHDDTLHWPGNKGFHYENDAEGEMRNEQNVSYYYKSDSFNMAIHTGTHLDAPRHFGRESWTVDQIPLSRLVNVPLQVIDVSEQVKVNRSYNFRKDDFIDPATNESRIRNNSVVLIYTGISKFYDNGKQAYFGTDTKNYNEMKIPGFSKEAAQFMVDSGVFGVGLDAASADSSDRHSGESTIDPVAHAILNGNNIYILENVNQNLEKLVGKADNYRLTILPLPIRNGSGSPVRLVAQLQDNCILGALTTNSAYSISGQLSIYASIIMALMFYFPNNYFH